ncbi:hypothetical protein ACIBF6_13210 [Streptosporangium amethystogenes]|uniref:hypothetical protein n=1 Tax=Streptosporangium amethystogenes TaxID=2002 RepID=UPI0037A165D1
MAAVPSGARSGTRAAGRGTLPQAVHEPDQGQAGDGEGGGHADAVRGDRRDAEPRAAEGARAERHDQGRRAGGETARHMTAAMDGVLLLVTLLIVAVIGGLTALVGPSEAGSPLPQISSVAPVLPGA